MEEEKDRYYRLFYPLSYDQEKEILNIWKSNIIKDFYNKNKEINKYCEEKGYDYMMALYSIYKSFPVYYICSYFEQNSSSCEIINDYINSFELRNFITNRIKRIKISKSNDSFLEDIENKIETMFNVLERENFYGFSQAKEQGFHDFNLININSIYQNVEEEEILKDIISDEIKKRRANPNVYIKKELITKVREGIDTIPEYRLTGFEELMYLPYDSNSIDDNIEPIENEQEEEEKDERYEKYDLDNLLYYCYDEFGAFNTEEINVYLEVLTEEYSLIMVEGLIKDTISFINNKIIDHKLHWHKEENWVGVYSEDEVEEFRKELDEEFLEGKINYFDDEIFDNSNKKLKKFFSLEEFWRLKFILDRLREIRDERSNINVANNINRKGCSKTTQLSINPIEAKLSKKQANYLIDGLIELECIDKESKDDMHAFLGINKTKEIINPIKWQKSKNLCAYFVDSFCFQILKMDRISWKPFEALFSLKGLVGAKNDFRKDGTNPKNAKEIKELIEKVIAL